MAGAGIARVMRTKVRHLPGRIATGAFILNSGLTKLKADDDTAKQLHGMASGTYPVLGDMDPHTFTKTLATAEIALGTTLLVPIVPSSLAGLGLAGFSGGLLGLYMNTPGMHREGTVRPTSDGVPLAKDSWMLGIALALLLDSGSWTTSRRKARSKAKAKAKKKARH